MKKIFENSVYLDTNIQIKIKKDECFLNKLENFLQNNKMGKYIFPYSPAHLEDLALSSAVAGGEATEEMITIDLENISKISANQELLPSGGNLSEEDFEKIKSLGDVSKKIMDIMQKNFYSIGTPVMKNLRELRNENPSECYKRVIDFYDRNLIEVNPTQHSVCSSIKELSNCSKEERKREIELIKKEIYSILENNRMQFVQENLFFVLEILFEHYINRLDRVRHWEGKEDINVKKKNLFISRTHDITHIIYASYCRYLITEDKALHQKAKELFELFDLKTKVILVSKEEFYPSLV